MRTNQQRPSGYISIALFLGVLLTIAVIGILLSSAMEQGGWTFIGLVVGLVIVSGLIIGGIAFGMNQYERRFDKRLEALKEDHRHREVMADKHILLDDEGYKPMQQINAPQAQPHGKVYDFNPNDIHTASVNYLLYSIALLGESGNRLASAPECAAATNLANYSARSWERIVKHLSAAYDVVTQPGPIQNGGGVYVPDSIKGASIGSIGKLYHHILLNSAVEALPENKRA